MLVPPQSSSRPGRWFLIYVTLGLILAVAAGLRFYHLDINSIWVDEDFTYLSTTGTQFRGYTAMPENVIMQHPPELTDSAHAKPWWTVLHPDTQDIHPPLYFFLLRIWASVVGWSAVQLRAFSILMSLIGITMLFAVVRQLSGTAAGLWAAAIMAVAQPQVDLGREARSYMMVLALGLATAWALVRIEKLGLNRRRLIALAIGALALPLTHYFAVFIDFTLVAYAVVRLRGKVRLAALAATAGPLLLFFLAWGPVLYLQAHGVSSGGTVIFHDTDPNHFLSTLARLALMPTRYLFEPLPNMLGLSMAAASLYLFPFVLFRRRPDLLLWGLWLPINILPSLLVDLTHHTFNLEIDRYVFFGSVAVYALIPAVCQNLRLKWWHVIPAVAIVGCLLHVSQAYSTFGRTRQNWRQFAKDYRELAEPGCLTIFPSALDDYMYYLCLNRYVSPLPGPALLLTSPPSPELQRQIRSYHSVLVVGGISMIDQYFPKAPVIDIRQMQMIGAIWQIRYPAREPASQKR